MFLAVDLQTFAQLSANGVINGAAYGLLGVGFALILGVTGRFHFAYSFTYALAAYAVFTLVDRLDVPFWPAVVVGLLLVTAFGVGVERAVYRPLAQRAGATALLAIFVASLGLGIAGENLVRLFWGSESQRLVGLDKDVVHLGDVVFLNFDVYSVLSSVVLVAVLAGLLRYTGLGRAIKATRVNPEMAQIIGINPATIYLVCFAVGTFFAGVAAFWFGLKFSVEPAMGFKPVIFAFVVAFLAGTARSPVRVFLTGLAVALVEQWSSIWLSVRWTQTAVFVILVLYLVYLSADMARFWARLRPAAPLARA